MWVHYLDPHEPYDSPPDLAASGPRYDNLIELAQGDDPDRKASARHELRILYNDEITYCDEWIGRLLAEVEVLGLRNRTVIVLTADHGEAFWERGVRGHGRTFQDEVLRIPLAVMLPDGDRAGTRVDAPTRLIDIMPTVLALSGVEVPGALRGRPLPSVLTDQPSEDKPRRLFAECRMATPERKALRSRSDVIVYQPDTRAFSSYGEPALFPLDPGDHQSDQGQLREWLRRMSVEMTGALAQSEQAAPTMTTEQKKALKALGYL